ncbi:MAG: SCO family protein [Rhodobacterales bacterium]|nr:SCO family protein [Rhodobacterales bacterium]NCT13570.1 SCO family protein [Rhodobacterales bacterium]
MTRSLFYALIAIVIAGTIGAFVATRGTVQGGAGGDDLFAQCRAGQVAGGDIGGPFTLIDKDGATVTDADVITTPSILYFGYTFCPDVCPFDNARNAAAVDLLEERGLLVTPVFISIDPERDTPAVVGRFADNFHDRMIGLTGSPEQVAAASRAYRTYYRKQEGDPEYYLVDHSTFSYLVLPGHGFVDFFRREDTAEAMADRVACFVDAAAN